LYAKCLTIRIIRDAQNKNNALLVLLLYGLKS